MISSGIRIGAWDDLRWKDIIPLSNRRGEVLAAKLKVYPGDSEEYYAFITPEAYNSIKEWIDFRSSYGEKGFMLSVSCSVVPCICAGFSVSVIIVKRTRIGIDSTTQKF
jgi:hypothetical protein